MEGKRSGKRRVRLTVSLSPTVFREAFPKGMINRSRVVQETLPLHRRETFRRGTEKFCATPDESDREDARRALPAQRETLDRD